MTGSGPRVLHLLASADRRGAEVFGTTLARELDGHGFVAEVLALGPAHPGTPALDVEVAPASHLATLRRLRASARRADVVVGHGSRGLPASTLATLAMATPSVYRSIGDIRQWAGATRARRFRTGLQLRRAAAVVALWPGAAEAIVEVFGVPSERVEVIPNSAPVDLFAPATPDERAEARARLGLGPGPVVAVVGAHGPEKRIPAAVDAVAELEGATVLVAGDGPERDRVEAAAVTLGERARILGAVDDVRPVYAAADVVLSTSRTEGQPGVLVEAALCGLAVVATDVGGSASVVGPRGLTVAPDAPATDIAAALRVALTLPPTTTDQLEGLRRDFGIGPVAARWADLLRRVARGPASAPT